MIATEPAMAPSPEKPGVFEIEIPNHTGLPDSLFGNAVAGSGGNEHCLGLRSLV